MPPKITGRWREKLAGKLRSPLGLVVNRAAAVGASFVPTLLAAGCSRAPTFNILGSFFPAWIVCGVLGILLTVAVRLFFVYIKLEDKLLLPLIVVYPCL